MLLPTACCYAATLGSLGTLGNLSSPESPRVRGQKGRVSIGQSSSIDCAEPRISALWRAPKYKIRSRAAILPISPITPLEPLETAYQSQERDRASTDQGNIHTDHAPPYLGLPRVDHEDDLAAHTVTLATVEPPAAGERDADMIERRVREVKANRERCQGTNETQY